MCDSHRRAQYRERFLTPVNGISDSNLKSKIADLLLLLIAAPMELVHYFARQFDSDGTACKVAEYSRILSAVASILNLLAVTVERFIVIVLPMRSRYLCTITNCKRSLYVVWGLSLLLSSPVLLTKSVYNMHYGNNESLVTVTYCNDFDDNLGFAFTIYQLVVCFALPGIIMIICYSVVIRVLWKSNINMAALTNNPVTRSTASSRAWAYWKKRNSPGSSLRANQRGVSISVSNVHSNARKTDDMRSARKQVIKMLICVVVLFLMCWGPRFIMEVLLKMQLEWIFQPSVYWTRVILFLLPFIHALFNPIVYFVMSKNFRKSAIKKFGNCSVACPPSHTHATCGRPQIALFPGGGERSTTGMRNCSMVGASSIRLGGNYVDGGGTSGNNLGVAETTIMCNNLTVHSSWLQEVEVEVVRADAAESTRLMTKEEANAGCADDDDDVDEEQSFDKQDGDIRLKPVKRNEKRFVGASLAKPPLVKV